MNISTPTQNPTVYIAVRDTILKGTQAPYNFKSGAFIPLITPSTPVLEALNTLFTSSLLSSSEKDIITEVAREFIVHPNHEQQFFVYPVELYITSPLTGALGKMDGMFQEDAAARGLHIQADEDTRSSRAARCKSFFCG
jgi:hypothetical protein